MVRETDTGDRAKQDLDRGAETSIGGEREEGEEKEKDWKGEIGKRDVDVVKRQLFEEEIK